WWKEERHGVFLDYNQNAKDRTVASAWSVRPMPDARVSMPLEWDEAAGCDPAAFTLVTAPPRAAPSRRRSAPAPKTGAGSDEGSAPTGPPPPERPGTGRRRSTQPLVTV